ncbi:MAG: ATP-binding protein [bacterium]
MNYAEIEKVSAVPAPASMIETFRAIGYSLETAVADIIDNSISANSKNIWLNSIWRGEDSIITIHDDGNGMNSEELIEALRPGTKHPLDDRNEGDLGRFGLGLKTASFSQCRMLSVISKREGYAPVYYSWDLDYVNESRQWELLRYIPEEFEHFFDDKNYGTLVVWSKIDRLLPVGTTSSDENAMAKFTESMERVKNHIAMTFHRFIEDKQVKLYSWERLIKPWNPFLASEPATQVHPEDYISNGATMRGYILPHKSRISEDVYKYAEGQNGWGAQQGFYVYRGRRLLLSGDWLGLFRKEEHYKLARIQIDLSNNLDTEWQIDIKKSTARPPLSCKDQLKSYAMRVRSQACEAFRHRGRIIKQRSGQTFQPLWLDKKKGNKWSFTVNRDHAIIQEYKDLAQTEPEKAIEMLLRFVEETIPTKTIFIKESEQGDSQTKPFEGGDNYKELIVPAKLIYKNQLIQGKTVEQAKAFLMNLDPFNNYPELIETLEEL